MNFSLNTLLKKSKQITRFGKDKLQASLNPETTINERINLNAIFKLRDKIFFKKKHPVSENYPFSVIDPFLVFDRENLVGDFNLVGDGWLDKNTDKPVALMWGFNHWKWGFASDYVPEYRTAFAPRKISSVQALLAISKFPQKPEVFIFWGYTELPAVRWYAEKNNIKIYRMEDGFIRSSSLGATHSTPYSLILESKELHYNPEAPSDIEDILNEHVFSEEELNSAKSCMNLMQELALSKYNPPTLGENNFSAIKIRKRVVVLGQVDNDMAIRLGNPDRWSMIELIRLAKIENPDADILYRPHPDIYQGFQESNFKKKPVEKICEIVSPEIPLIEFLDTVDHVYTITSLSGLEALLRGKKVTVVGAAFYAGWGLTDDRITFPRRVTKRTLLELFAGVYLKYPRYLADLNDSEIGFKAAALRIKADHEVAAYDMARKTNLVELKNVELFAQTEYWPQLFFCKQPDGVLESAEKVISTIKFSRLLNNNPGRLFQLTLLYAICGRLTTNEARNLFITTVRKYIDIDVLNELLISLSNIHPGNYVITQLAWLITENKDNEASVNILSSHLRKLKVLHEKDSERQLYEVDDQNSESLTVTKRQTINDEQYEILLNLLDNHIEHRKLDKAIEIATGLLIEDYATPNLLLKLAKIAELKFDSVSARAISNLCQKIDLYGENRKALTIHLHNLPTSDEDIDGLELMQLLALELRLNPERINNSFVLSKRYLQNHLIQSVIEAMIRLDNSLSIQKAMAYLEVGQINKSLRIIQDLALNGNGADKLKVFYSKALSGLGMYQEALEVMAQARRIEATELNYRESLRLLTYLGLFHEAYQLVKDAQTKKIFISEAVLIPMYLGMKNIESGYKCYLNVPFREVVINYFSGKYTQSEVLSPNNLLIMSVYGPGDEIRFASLYGDFLKKYSLGTFKVTCDYRLESLLKRSFPEIEFCPIRRTRDYSSQYPRELYDQLPGSDLCTILDNAGLEFVSKADEIVMVTDLIWQFRKSYKSFSGEFYLKHDEALANIYANKLPKGKKLVGINWRSSLTNFARIEHYLSIEDLERLFTIENIQFVNLQYDECSVELDWIESKYPGKLINIESLDQYNDLDGVAALMMSLDLVIAPATSVAELSGSLGCTTWLISNSSELHWRKIDIQGTDVWHKSMTHVEGAVLGNKTTLVDTLYRKLIDLASY